MKQSTLFLSYIAYRDAVLKSLVLSILVLSAFISGVGEAKAVSFEISTIMTDYEDADMNNNGVLETNYEFTLAWYIVNTDKAIYRPGETINIAGTAYGELCENYDPYTTLAVSLEGASDTLIDSYVGYQEGWLYGLGTLTAPMVPGTYDITVDACYMVNPDYLLEYPGLSGCADETITITVVDSLEAPVADPSNPKGSFSALNCTVAIGWTCDSDDYSQPLEVEFYEGSTYLHTATAGVDTGAYVISNACGGDTAHAFYTYFPEDKLHDGVTHTISAYAQNILDGSGDTQLVGTYTLTCPVNPDIAVFNNTPGVNSVYKKGTQVRFEATAVNTQSRDFPAATWTALEIDIDGDGYRGSKPWYDEYEDDTDKYQNYYDIPEPEKKLVLLNPNESKRLSYTLSSLPVGDHEYRFEVDVTDIVDYEQNGENNYTPWTTIHVIDGDLTINQSTVPSGEAGTVSWTTENTDGFTCKVETDAGVIIGTGANGTNVTTGILSDDVTYILSCESIILDGPIVLDVVETTGLPDLSASNLLVEQGNPTNLTWNTNNGDEKTCTLTGGTLATNPLADDGGDVNTGSEQVTVTARTTYTLTCPLGSDTVTVEVVPKAYET